MKTKEVVGLLTEKRKDETKLNIEIKHILENLSKKWNNAKIEMDIEYSTIHQDSGEIICIQHMVKSQIEIK